MRHRTVRLAALAGAALVTFTAAACGSDDSADESVDRTSATTSGAAQPSTEATETSTPSDAADSSADADAFPVTVPHAFGETVVESEPARVVAWGWASADAAIALGVVPVAIPFQEYGGDESGVLPWIREALDERGAEVPTVLPNVESPPFEAIAAADPDLILAAYSGISDTDYALLSDIAPTIAYPDQPWATDWRELVRIVGTSLGRASQADAVLTSIDEAIAEQAAAHPELAGKTVAQVWDVGDTFYVYKPADPRVGFSLGLGLESAPSVDELSTDESTFYFTLSHERLAELTSDILVTYADTPEASAAFLESEPAQLMAQVTDGRVAEIVGAEFVASVSPPTALSLTWGLDEYVAALSAAAQAAPSAG